MKRYCVNLECSEHQSKHLGSTVSGQVSRKGFFYRQCDRRYIQRFKCLVCKTQFSRATFDPDYRQHRREINERLFVFLASGGTQRRAAIYFETDRKTILRKLKILGARARADHQEWLVERFQDSPVEHMQFDDLETSEHTKCKPLSVTLAVRNKSREILDFQVKRMPAKGHLSKIARRKYGMRKDERPEGWNQLFKNLKPLLHPEALCESDENPHYPKHLKRYFPHAKHIRHKGARGAIVGQGELKKQKYDPLFSLNHTCAMLRANINRLFRKTWNTTKKVEALIDHLWIYVRYHNAVLVGPDL
ncbi:MAG: hypothetical protein KGP28_11590 [Bdellovibrionales bacterium]|nr:hypothetical protein [Bdellovibrionales bacterium]